MIVLHVNLLLLLAFPPSRAKCLDTELTSTCLILFNSFQSALVERELNLYKLSKTFFPITKSMPNMVNVSYSIAIAPSSEESCLSSTKVNVTEETASTNNTNFTINFAWTTEIFYTLIHPATLHRMQPQLLLKATSTADSAGTTLTWNGVGSFNTIRLELNPVLLPCIPTKTDIIDTLKYITAYVRKLMLCYTVIIHFIE